MAWLAVILTSWLSLVSLSQWTEEKIICHNWNICSVFRSRQCDDSRRDSTCRHVSRGRQSSRPELHCRVQVSITQVSGSHFGQNHGKHWQEGLQLLVQSGRVNHGPEVADLVGWLARVEDRSVCQGH